MSKKINKKTENTKKAKEDFLKAFKLTMGNISEACKKANVSRRTFYNWIEKDEEFLNTQIEVKESKKDFAEQQLYKAIKEGKTTELIFFLKTQCKDRGYIEKTEVETSGQSTQVIINKTYEKK